MIGFRFKKKKKKEWKYDIFHDQSTWDTYSFVWPYLKQTISCSSVGSLQYALPQAPTAGRVWLKTFCSGWSVPWVKIQQSLAEFLNPVQSFLFGVSWKPTPKQQQQHYYLSVYGRSTIRTIRKPDLSVIHVTQPC